MRIILINDTQFSRDLCKSAIISITKALLAEGHSVILIVPKIGKTKDYGLGRNLVYMPTINIRILQTIMFVVNVFFYLIPKLFTFKPDIVLFGPFSFFPLLPFIILSKLGLIKAKFILDIRTLPADIYDFIRKLGKTVFEITLHCSKFLSNYVTVISPFMKEQICSQYRILPSNVAVWSSGVDPDIFNPLRVSSRLNLPFLEGKFVIMYHGVLSGQRGLQETICAIDFLHIEHPDIVFLILGDGWGKKILEDMITSLRLEKNVLLHKSVSYEDVPRFISACDVGILPFPNVKCWKVSSPIKLMEYLSMEKPVIITDIEAHREVVSYSPCGIFIPNNDPKMIAAGIIKAYNSRSFLREMGKTGREIIERNYTWKKQAENLTDFLESL
jgi:glycosyltransferase involved in cell wall biosynthesis